MQSFGVVPREVKVRGPGFDPDQIGVWRVGQAAGDHRIDSAANAEEAFGGAFTGAEGRVSFVHVAGQQRGSERIRARNDDARNAADVGSQPGCIERTNVLSGGNEDFAAEMPALLFGGELILPVRLPHRH